MNYDELKAFGRATGGELTQDDYTSICEAIGADLSKGVTKPLLLIMYTDADEDFGDIDEDFEVMFKS